MKHLFLILFLILFVMSIQTKAFAQVEFVIPMTEGWNMISSPVVPEVRETREIFGDLVGSGNLIIVKDAEGRFSVGGLQFWMLGDWVQNFGYQVKLERDDVLTMIGEPVDPETPIDLRQNWSMIAYFPEERVDAITALSNIEELLIIAKDGFGHFYNTEFNFSNMGERRQGRGYLVKVREATELVWNVE